MSALNISLPAAMKAFVDTQVRSGLYSTASDYVRTLIRDAQHRQAAGRFDAQLVAYFDRVPDADMPPEVWAWLRTRLRHLPHAGAESRG